VTDFPRSLIEFQQRFADEAACVRYLFAARWPEGFVCRGCGTSKAWELQTKPWTWECAGCGRQTSVTAGTIMHYSKLPLTTWFWAAYLNFEVNSADREQLAAVVVDRNSPQKHVWRAQIILATAEGCGAAEVMRRAGVSKPCVWRWQERFMREGVAGLLHATRRWRHASG